MIIFGTEIALDFLFFKDIYSNIDFGAVLPTPIFILIVLYPSVFNETLDEVSVSTTFVQSKLVSVSTNTEFPSLDES